MTEKAALARARRALGMTDGEPVASGVEGVRRLIEAVEARLGEIEPDDRELVEARAAHAEQLERLAGRYEARAAALATAREAATSLRELTSPGAILTAAPECLCRGSRFERAVLSLIRNGSLITHSAYFEGDPDGAAAALEALQADPPRLEHPLVENELMRRRRATIVASARTHPRVHRGLAEAMDWDGYAAAPVPLGNTVAVLYADRRSGAALDVLDGDILWTFASGLADAVESAALRRSLRTQRSELRDLLEWLAARSGELSDPTMELGVEHEAAPGPPGPLDVIAGARGVDERLVFQEVLTRRELDVLRLLARGETNHEIAARLVIAPGTVKFHVGNILDKLRVSNRAQAVSRYHSLVDASGD